MKTTLAPLAIALAVFAGSGAALAQVSHDPAAVKGGVYTVEPNHTRVLFAVSHMDFTTWYGDFTGVSGKLDLHPNALATSRVSISIPTDSLSTTNTTLDGELKGGGWLDASKFSTITFTSTQVVRTGPKTARITGDLTIRGVTHPVTLDAKFNAGGINPLDHKYTIGFDATGHIKRSDYGVKKYVPVVGDQVDLIISAGFEKAD